MSSAAYNAWHFIRGRGPEADAKREEIVSRRANHPAEVEYDRRHARAAMHADAKERAWKTHRIEAMHDLDAALAGEERVYVPDLGERLEGDLADYRVIEVHDDHYICVEDFVDWLPGERAGRIEIEGVFTAWDVARLYARFGNETLLRQTTMEFPKP